MEKAKEIIKDILYIWIISFCIAILIIALISVIINIKYFFNLGYLISSIINKSSNETILSLNVGILQAFIAIIGIGIVIAAYFNFTTIRDKLKEVDKVLDEHKQSIDETKEQINDLINIKYDNKEKQFNIEIEKSEKEIKKLINKKEKGETTDDYFGREK